jgi:acyl-CoA reductase-like NAD-dependent aldehyde dehydrogenase
VDAITDPLSRIDDDPSRGGTLHLMSAIPDTRLGVASKRYGDGPSLDVHDRWTGELLAKVTMADAFRAEEAAAACERAFEATRAMRAHERRDLLRRVAQGIAAKGDMLATLIAREAGKPITYARAEVARAVSTFELGAEEATRQGGEVMPLDITVASAAYSGQWVRVPAGPVMAIAPFNFPLNLVAHKIAPALACGCSVILKPPPQAPLTSLALGEILREAGMPENAVQIVPCGNDVAERLVRDARFATLSFTGSAKVGWYLKSVAGKKRVILELGGNAAALVHADAKLPWALDRITAGAFGYAGQVCIKVQRVYVDRAIGDAFVDGLVERARALRPMSPMDDTAVIGPMIDEANAARVDAWVNEARDVGARALVHAPREGARLGPTVLEIDGPGIGLKVVDEEVFGPVVTVHRYDSWDEALRWADDTRYGLQAGVFTDSHARIREAFAKLHVGGLIVNDTPTFRVDSMPYGGMRDSGFGREGVRFAIDEMTEKKLLVVRE